jgi:hypothetical protein
VPHGEDTPVTTLATIGFDPAWPLPRVVALGLLAVTLAVWLSVRGGRPRGGALATAVLRAAAMTAIAVVLLNPIFSRVEKATGKPPLLVLMDNSHSMAVPDVGGRRRFDVAKGALLEDHDLLQEFGQRYTPTFFSVAESATWQEIGTFRATARPAGGHTRLGEAMINAVSSVMGRGPGGVLLVSDGRSNGEVDPVEVARQARARHFPVFTLCLGTAARGSDVALVNRRPQVFAAPRQEVTLTAELRSAGYSGQTARAQLLREGRPVAVKSVTLDDRNPVPVSFAVTEPRAGDYRYTVAVDPLPREASDSNNRGTVFLRVLEAKTRVLVVEGRPTWDAKFLIQALHSDPSIELDAVFKLTGDKFFAVRGAVDPGAQPVAQVKLPGTAAEFAKYDVVVIGKGVEDLFSDAGVEALKRYVADHAGSVVLLRGQAEERGHRLEVLEPVRWSEEQIRDFRLQLTEEGRRNPAFSFGPGEDAQTVIQKLPTMISATRVEGEKALAVVLARAGVGQAASLPSTGKGQAVSVPSAEKRQADSPSHSREMAVLAYQNYGQGKVVALVGQGLWRWAFLPPEMQEYASCYNDFWTHLMRWLVSQSDFLPGQEVTLRTDRGSYAPDDTVNLMAFVRGKAASQLPAVRIAAPDGAVATVRLSKAGGKQADFIGAFRPKLPGEYLASLTMGKAGQADSLPHSRGVVTVPFSVFEGREEDIVTAADPELMRRIAAAGGGEALSLHDLRALPHKLREIHAASITKTEARPAWDRWWVLAGILGALSLEWGLRRRMGLV